MRTFLVGLTSFALGVGVTHWWIGSDDPSGRSSPARGDVDADSAVVVAVRAENARLEAELARVRAERPEATPETDAPEGTVAKADQSTGHATGRFFVDPKHENALRAVDWKPIGAALRWMTKR